MRVFFQYSASAARYDRVELALREQVDERAVGPGGDGRAFRQIQLHLLDPAGLSHARLDPLDAREVDAVLVLEHAAHVDAGGLRPLGNADPLALQILGLLDGGVFRKIDRRMAEDARQEHRDADDFRLVLRHERDHLAEGHLGSLPLAELGEAVEDLLDRQLERHDVDAGDAHLTAQHLAHVLVRIHRQSQGNIHRDRIKPLVSDA